MDPGTIAGIALAFTAIFASMILEGGSPTSILLVPAMVLVLGGTMGAAMAGGMLKDFLGIIGSFQRVLLGKATASDDLVDSIVKLAEKARREGLLALEDAMKDVGNPFLKKGLQLAIDGTDSDELRDILDSSRRCGACSPPTCCGCPWPTSSSACRRSSATRWSS